MHKRILVGLDGSSRQAGVLKEALTLAAAQGAKLELCRAMAIPVSIPTVLWTLQGDDFESFLVEHGEKELQLVAAKIPEEIERAVHCRVGQPADVLCTLAEELKADLLIIGTHGYDRIDRVLGTTAAKVVNRAPCSVMVVRERG
jgi:nucleotide-binding universal stress UspA family protein